MVRGSRSKGRQIASTAGSIAVDALKLAAPVAKTLPLVGNIVEGSIQAVLQIIQVKEEVQMKKEKCERLTERVVTITAAVVTELMKNDGNAEFFARQENNVAALRGTLHRIDSVLVELTDVSFTRRVFGRGDVDKQLTHLQQQLEDALNTFHIAAVLRNDQVLNHLMITIRTGEDNALMTRLLKPILSASYLARDSQSGCLPGTRTVVLEKVASWFDDDSPDSPQIFWLSGLGGVGKTAISHSICEIFHGRNQLGASFFFSRDVAERRQPSTVIPTLAYQLALSHPGFRDNLCGVLRQHPDAPGRAQQYQFTELLVDPLKKVVPRLPSFLVVLDALDECGIERGKEGGDLLPLILREIPHSGLKIKILITSRPEKSIEDMFRKSAARSADYNASILHDIDRSTVENDIKIYLDYHLSRIQIDRDIVPPWPSQVALNELVAQAGLFFIFAATIVNWVEDRYYSPQTQLQQLLRQGNGHSSATYQQVNMLYLHILRTSVEGRLDALALCARFRKVVGAIVLLQDPLSLKALAELLQHDQDDLEYALNPLHSLLDIPSDRTRPIRIFHPSFRDFLLTEGRCEDPRFAIPEVAMHAQLALACLDIMLKGLRRDICGVEGKYVLNSEIPSLSGLLSDHVASSLSYASEHWATHLAQVDDSCAELNDVRRLLWAFSSTNLLHWIELLSLRDKFSICVANLVTVNSWCKARSMEDENSKLLYDAYRVVLDFQKVIRDSAFQIYHSALVFIPHCTLLHQYAHDIPSSPKLASHRTDNWDVCLLVLEGHTAPLNSLSFAHESSIAVSGSDDCDVRLWNTIDGGHVLHLTGHLGPVRSVVFSPDGASIASASDDKTIRLWDVATGRISRELFGHTGAVNSVAFSANGRLLVSGCADCTVRVWDALGGVLQESLSHSASVTCVGIAHGADGEVIISGSLDGDVRIWDIQTHELQGVIKQTHPVLCLSASSETLVVGLQDGSVCICDRHGLQVSRVLPRFDGEVRSIAFSLSGRRIVMGSADGVIRIWDMLAEKFVSELRGHSGFVASVSFGRDGSQVISASGDRTIRVWDTSVTNDRGASDWAMAAAISSDLKHVVSGSSDGVIALRTVADNHLVWERQIHKGNIMALYMTANNKLAASASVDKTICVLDTQSGNTVATLTDHTDAVYCAMFSSDASLLVSASADGTARVWNSGTWKCTLILQHELPVGVATFSPNNQLICSGTERHACVWNVKSGQRVWTSAETSSPLLWVALSPDARWMVAWFEDEAVQVWQAMKKGSFQPVPHREWRLDHHRAGSDATTSEAPGYDDLVSPDDAYYLQEDGWVTIPRTRRRICWVPPSRRPPWLRSLWYNRQNLFVMGSQAGALTILNLAD